MENTLNDILSIVQFLKDNAAMKQDMDERFDKVEADIVSIHSELASVRTDIANLSARLENLEKHWQEDSDVQAQELVDLRGRVVKLETEVARLQQLVATSS